MKDGILCIVRIQGSANRENVRFPAVPRAGDYVVLRGKRARCVDHVDWYVPENRVVAGILVEAQVSVVVVLAKGKG